MFASIRSKVVCSEGEYRQQTINFKHTTFKDKCFMAGKGK